MSSAIRSAARGWQLLEEEESFEGLRETISWQSYFTTALGILGLLLMVCSYVVPSITEELPFAPWIGFLCYVTYLYDAHRSKTWKYVSNVYSEQELVDYVSALQGAAPQISFQIRNYHYESQHRDMQSWEHGSYGQRGEPGRLQRIDTHSATLEYNVAGHEDCTMSLSEVLALQGQASGIDLTVEEARRRVLMLLCEFRVDFHPRDKSTAQDLPIVKNNFYIQNTFDTFQDKHENHSLRLDKYRPYLLAVLTSKGPHRHTRPWWMNRYVFGLCTLCLLSLPFRIALFNSTWKVVWKVTKHFSMLPEAEWTGERLHEVKVSADPSPVIMGASKNETHATPDNPSITSLSQECGQQQQNSKDQAPESFLQT